MHMVIVVMIVAIVDRVTIEIIIAMIVIKVRVVRIVL